MWSFVTAIWSFVANFLPNLWSYLKAAAQQVVGYVGGMVSILMVWAKQGLSLCYQAVRCLPVVAAYKLLSVVCYLATKLFDVLAAGLPEWAISDMFSLPDVPPIVKGMALILPVVHLVAILTLTVAFIIPYMVVGAVTRWIGATS